METAILLQLRRTHPAHATMQKFTSLSSERSGQCGVGPSHESAVTSQPARPTRHGRTVNCGRDSTVQGRGARPGWRAGLDGGGKPGPGPAECRRQLSQH